MNGDSKGPQGLVEDGDILVRLEAQHADLKQGAFFTAREDPVWDATADAAAEIEQLRAWKSEAVSLLEDYAAAGKRTMEALRAAEQARDEERDLADLLAARCRKLGGLEEAFDVSQQAWSAARRKGL